MFDIHFLFGCILTTLLILVGHWFPWPVRLHRLAAYGYGCTSILIGAGVWLGLNGQDKLWLGFAILTALAGTATGLSYLVDWALTARKAQKAFEQALVDDERAD